MIGILFALFGLVVVVGSGLPPEHYYPKFPNAPEATKTRCVAESQKVPERAGDPDGTTVAMVDAYVACMKR